jgi:hypothetical protein
MTDASSETGETIETGNGVVPHLRPVPAQPATGGGGGPFDLNDRQKKVVLVVLLVHLVVARFTLRDLRRRPAAAVRGPKRLWRVWATMNTTGSVAYWLVGRRGGTPSAPDTGV